MKKLVLLYLLLVSGSVLAQNKETIAIKIYLEDAYNGKNIPDAKVTLEGFEIPEIVGKYDKKGKYYYFTEIPKGYNTVMAYHKKYNEKGFQNVNGLPKEVRLKLYDPLNVSYSFEKPVLSKEISYSGGKKVSYAVMPKVLDAVLKTGKTICKPNFRFIYVEDQYHIAIISKYDSKQFFNNDTIKKLLRELSLEEFEPNESLNLNYEIDSWTGYLMSCKKGGCLTINGVDYVYLLNKKDGTGFKRFNSAEIKKIRESNFTVAALTNRMMEYYSDTPYNVERYYGIGYKNHKELLEHHSFMVGKIVQAYYDTEQIEYKMFYGNFDPNSVGDNMPSSDEDIGYNIFFVIPKEGKSGIGLGALDNIELDNSMRNNYFFNNNYNNK